MARLARLEYAVRLSVAHIPKGGQSYLLASGWQPNLPVTFSIDGNPVVALTANALGDVTYMINPALRKLATGTHAISLSGILLTETASFTSRWEPI